MDTQTDMNAIAPDRGIGDNNPPGTVELDRAAELVANAKVWTESRPAIEDEDEAKAAHDMVAKLKDAKKALVAAAKSERQPLDDAIADLATKYKPPSTEIDDAVAKLAGLTGAWLVKERERLAAEQRARDEEARRKREEEERADRERREAQQRLDDERRRVAEDQARRRLEAERQGQTELEKVAEEAAAQAELERVEAARQEAARAIAEADEKAKAAKEAERLAARKPETAAIRTGTVGSRAMTLRTYWSAVIEDEAAAMESYRDNPVVRKATLTAVLQAANEAARTAKDESKAPVGVRFVKEERAQ